MRRAGLFVCVLARSGIPKKGPDAMTLRESELSRPQRGPHNKPTETKAKRKQQARKKKARGRRSLSIIGIGHNGGPPLKPLRALVPLLDEQVLTFREWCHLCAISLRTGRRILAGPCPPAVVRLSPRRIGITVKANREWQAARAQADER